MRIGVNTRLLLKGKLEGVGWFSHQILSRMVRNHPEHEFVFFFDRPYDETFVYADNVTPVIVAPQARHPFLYYIWTEWQIPRMLKKHKIDLYLSTEGLGSLSTKVPTCITIHDLAYRHYPQFMDKLHRWHYAKYLPKFAHAAKHIITVSDYTQKDVCDSYHIPLEKTSVVYNSADERFIPLGFEEKQQVKAQYTDGQEYFIFTGALHPRKNVINLLKAFVQFKRWQKSKMKLVIVGRMAWQYNEIVEAQQRMPFKEDVIWTGYLDSEELAKITAAAYAMVYPSLFEGFGIPIVEAMYCDVPSIVSNTSSMPEVGGNAALLVDPNDIEDIAGKMQLMYKDERLRKQLIENGKQHRQMFNWNRSAQLFWEAAMKAYNS